MIEPAFPTRLQHFADVLVRLHGFVPDEARRYLMGDRTVISAVMSRLPPEEDPPTDNTGSGFPLWAPKDRPMTWTEHKRFWKEIKEPWRTMAAEANIADVVAIWPGELTAEEIDKHAQAFVEHHQFTHEEAVRHTLGDRTAIEAVVARRRAAEDDCPDANAETE